MQTAVSDAHPSAEAGSAGATNPTMIADDSSIERLDSGSVAAAL